MPIYEYKCRKCKKRFEELVKIGETPACPRCHDPNPERLFSMTAAVSTSTTRERRKPSSPASRQRSAAASSPG